ncbi:MAG: hypothetical protein NZ521_00075 [Flammeovirgaceae bacterium]|nr:hypothetical protein [Flammeovirgaceae bacterium]MDW8286449.1 hypothetical protein [Flammeovirgaceae bacterium]
MENFFDDLVKRLFPSPSEGKKATVPLLTEPIRRSEKEKQAYQAWLHQESYRTVLKDLRESYYFNATNNLLDLQIFRTNAANGIALPYHRSISLETFQHLFDWWKDKTIQLGYRLQIAERRFLEEPTFIKTIEKYYLKPMLSYVDFEENQPLDQKYGNVLLELHIHDNRPHLLKLLTTIYSDRLYLPAQPFEEFMHIILS